MQPDDLYPNDGTPFILTEPSEQKEARTKEKAEVYEALPVMERVIAHFDERIQVRDSLQSIGVDLEQDPLLHQKICAVNSLLKLALEEERGYLVDLIDQHVE